MSRERWRMDRDRETFRRLTIEALADGDAHTTGRTFARDVYQLTPEGTLQ